MRCALAGDSRHQLSCGLAAVAAATDPPSRSHCLGVQATGKSRGFAFLAYEDQRSTVLAVDNLNGAKVSGGGVLLFVGALGGGNRRQHARGSASSAATAQALPAHAGSRAKLWLAPPAGGGARHPGGACGQLQEAQGGGGGGGGGGALPRRAGRAAGAPAGAAFQRSRPCPARHHILLFQHPSPMKGPAPPGSRPPPLPSQMDGEEPPPDDEPPGSAAGPGEAADGERRGDPGPSKLHQPWPRDKGEAAAAAASGGGGAAGARQLRQLPPGLAAV